MGAVPQTVVVIPCFNERRRLDPEAVEALLSSPSVRVLFVDDGSTDGTGELLQQIAAQHPERIETLSLPANRGKAEAVRAGLQHALEQGAAQVGYLDADFSTPPDEMVRLVEILDGSQVAMVLGSRVRLLGREVERRLVRHYLGRVFATVASLSLGLAVYDTQCGAKVMRRSPALEHAVAAPFVSKWAFDVELLSRLLHPPPGIPALAPTAFLEVPLKTWRDVQGSKLHAGHMLKAGLDLLRIAATRPR